jgi:hypothetical protein
MSRFAGTFSFTADIQEVGTAMRLTVYPLRYSTFDIPCLRQAKLVRYSFTAATDTSGRRKFDYFLRIRNLNRNITITSLWD